MNLVIAPTASTTARAAAVRRWVLWAGVAALSAPIAIMLHELGHFAAAHAFGFPEITLHYGSVSVGAAEANFPAWQQGLQAAAGPLITLAIVFSCCYAVVHVGPQPWAIAPAFAAGVRSIAIGGAYLVVRLRHPSAQGNFDEMNTALHLGLAPEAVVAANVLLLLGAWGYLIYRIPGSRRAAALTATVAGTAAGVTLYIGWWGPWLLP